MRFGVHLYFKDFQLFSAALWLAPCKGQFAASHIKAHWRFMQFMCSSRVIFLTCGKKKWALMRSASTIYWKFGPLHYCVLPCISLKWNLAEFDIEVAGIWQSHHCGKIVCQFSVFEVFDTHVKTTQQSSEHTDNGLRFNFKITLFYDEVCMMHFRCM